MGKVKREGASVTVEMTQEEFQSVIDRLGYDPARSDYSIVCEYVAQKTGKENAVRITYADKGMIMFIFVPDLDQFVTGHY